ncbi:MAG: BF3164 family lipoprotein [Bacteroidales bacterium]|nr:BF3164 family lipoprotein [Bacteroidales bacterium]MDD3200407.1 BF3164 family lipoprotein [Bacteroidales bacterium]
MRKLIIFLLIISALSACSSKDADNRWRDKIQKAESKVGYIDTAFLGTLYRTVPLTNDFIAVGIYNDKDHCDALLEMRNDSLIQISKFAPRGRGGQELISCQIVRDLTTGYYYLCDITNGQSKIIKTNTDDVAQLVNQENWQVFDVRELQHYFVAYPLDNQSLSFLIGSEHSNPKRKSNSIYSRLDSSGITPLSIQYPKNETNIKNKEALVYSGRVHQNPSRLNRFAYIANNIRFMHIFEYADGDVHLIKEMYNVPAKYSLRKDGLNIRFDDDSYIGVLSAYVTGKYVYVLMNDLIYDEVHDETIVLRHGAPARYSNNVYVFDWDGNDVKKIVLDKYITTFVVNHDDSKLYGINNIDGGETSILYVFDLLGEAFKN